MKIICVDNFNRDYISDKLIAENVSDYFAKLIVEFLNSREGERSPDFYKAVPDDHKIYLFEP